jgi:hypothetical protein
VGWCGPETERSEGDYTARVFCPQGLALTARGPQAPTSKQQSQLKAVIDEINGRISRSAAQAIRQPRDRLKGQPQERQHSAAVGGTRDRLPPARGTIFLARGMEARRAETRNPKRDQRGSARASPVRRCRTRHHGIIGHRKPVNSSGEKRGLSEREPSDLSRSRASDRTRGTECARRGVH